MISVARLRKSNTKQDKTLFLFMTGQPEYELTPSKVNEFTCKTLKGFVFRFNVDGQGKVTELVFESTERSLYR